MTDPQRHGLTLLAYWTGVALVSLALCSAAHAQAPAGYIKLNGAPVTAANYTDTQMASGVVLNYLVTAVNQVGESGPSNVVTATIPNTAVAHSVTLTWDTVNEATGYNVYREQILIPSAPSGLTEVVQ